MAIEDRGFASMDSVKQKEIASKGGRAAHVKGTAHEWDHDEAVKAGHLGGLASHRRRGEVAKSVVLAGPQTTDEPGDSADL